MRTLVLILIGAVGSMAFAAVSEASGRRARVDSGATEAWGCYWHRGRQHCHRYCYIEVNGLRYCQEHERDAVSQALVPWHAGDPGEESHGGRAAYK